MILKHFAAIAVIFTLSACATGTKDHFEAREIKYHDMSGWAHDDHVAALKSFQNSCPILAKKSRPETALSEININSTIWNSLCSESANIETKEQARSFFERRFTPYRISNNKIEKGLFTGYYEPILYGSLKKNG